MIQVVMQITSFIPESPSKASLVVAEADVSLGCFWAMCSNSVEILKDGTCTQLVLTREYL